MPERAGKHGPPYHPREGVRLDEQRLAEGLGGDREDRELLAAILESMIEGVLVCDHDSRLVLLNRAARRLLEPEVAEPVGRLLQEVHPSPLLKEAVDDALLRGEVIEREMVLARQEALHLRVVVVPLHHQQAMRGAVAVLHDVTALRQLERVRRDFVANVSHEMRTPLATITGYAETLLSGAVALGPVAREFVETIDRHGRRLTSLVADLLTLARLEAGGEGPRLAPVSLEELSAEVSDAVEHLCHKRGVALEVELDPRVPHVLGEPKALTQVLRNLVENGIHYTDPGGRVLLRSHLLEPGHRASIEIRDTGVGIAPQHLPRIFERFYRVDPGRSREAGGTGLGLSIVKHLVQAMKGRVEVESVSGSGSVFRVILYLPGADEDDTDEPL